jgi:hypothetical protein
MQMQAKAENGALRATLNLEDIIEKCYGKPRASDKTALDVQIGGTHYKDMAIQPMEYSMANKLDACQHTIIKYVSRFRAKGGVQDLEKAKHCIDMLIAFEKRAGK